MNRRIPYAVANYEKIMTQKHASLCLCMLLCAFAAAADAAARPNILFIAIDDLRPELGCYGSEQVKTPNIDRLAAQGMLLSRVYCQVPVCGASRASLMTGILPTSKRFVNYNTYAQKDAPDAVTLPELFKRTGYTALSNGKVFHHRDDCEDRSWSEPAWSAGAYDESHDPETIRHKSKRGRGRFYEAPDVADDAYPDGRVARKTVSDLQRLKHSGKPFFLACGFTRPHLPFYAPKRYWDLYGRDTVQIAGNRSRPESAPGELKGSGEFRSYHLADLDENSDEFHRVMRHGYLACVSYVDQLVGELLGELDRLGLAESTVVVLWGDHGWHLGEHNFWGKHNTMHLSTRVPLIVRVPGRQGGSSAALVETSDIFPTLCSLAGIAVPATVQGRSFEVLLDRPGEPFREVAYSRFAAGDAVITERFNYTSYGGGKAEMFYDLEKDPAENRNVADNPEYREVVAKMRKLLARRQQEAAAATIGKQ
jgi:iduronate 2-sulfatase